MHESRRPTGRLVPLAAAGALALSIVAVPPAVALPLPDGNVEINIAGINDFHGRLEANQRVAGAAVLAGAVNDLRTYDPNALFVSAGDNIGASTFTSFIADDQPTIDALNGMGLDVSALGNHEFDQGRADLDDRVIGGADGVDFPYLAANLYEAGTTDPAYDEYWITDVDGVAVGFIGAMTEDLPSLVSPAGIASLDVGPMLPAVNRVADQLTDGDPANGEADVVVLLVHEGASTEAEVLGDNDFGNLVRGLSDDVHAVFSGHTHAVYAVQQDVDGWERPVIQSGEYGENLAYVTIEYDPAAEEVVGTTSEVIPLVEVVPGEDGNEYVPLFTADPAVQAIVDAAVDEAEVLGAVPLGEITSDLRRAVQGDGSENRGGESTLGNLVADVQLWATQDLGTQIAFMNPGGLRTDLAYESSEAGEGDGVVTYREAAEVQPFANTLFTMQLTGAQVVQVLEEQWQPDGASRPFLKLGVSGITYTYDPTADRGERISEIWLADGSPLDLGASYTVLANSFLSTGGDNFFTFAEGTARSDSGRIDLQAFVDYMAEFTPVSPDLAQRSVGVRVTNEPEAGYAAGDEVTVELSSLLFSAAEGQGGTVVLSIGDQEVASADIDPSVVDTMDEQGRAAVTFALPAGLTGETATVAVTVPGSGTASAVTVGIVEAAAPPVVTPPAQPAPPATGRNPGLRVETGR